MWAYRSQCAETGNVSWGFESLQIDKDAQRLAIAKQIGSIPVNVNDHKDVTDYILFVEPHRLDKTVECSGFRSADSPQHKAIRATRLEGDSLLYCLDNNQGDKKVRQFCIDWRFLLQHEQLSHWPPHEKAIKLQGGQMFAQKAFSLFPH